MCGIFGYIGLSDSKKICLSGLKLLEYRGYDSAGLAGIHKGKLIGFKELGKIHLLEKALSEDSHQLDLAIGHTRWATHGKPSTLNAHPHFDHTESIAIVHNGILENHHSLREKLKKEGIQFKSDTDSEVIAQLISYFYRGNLSEAVKQALNLMRGFWGLAVIHKNHPNQIIATAKENPISVALSQKGKEAFLSSDPHAFNRSDLDIYFLKNHEIAHISRETIEIFDENHLPISKSPSHIHFEEMEFSKNGYDHYMLKEIFEQPQTIRNAIHGRFIQDYGTVEFENLPLTTKELLSIGRIVILGCGTSWHAGCIAASQLEEMARIPASAEIASEFRYKNPIISQDTLIIAISQSGETLDTISAVREAKNKGAKILAICNVSNSTLTREADATILLRAGPEISVCSTKAFTSQLTVLSLFAILMARLRHMSKEEGILLLDEIRALPELVSGILEKKQILQKLAKKYASFKHFFFLGRHYMYPTSLEGALKLKEISYLFADAFPAGEMKHGPLALVDKKLATIGLCGNLLTAEKIASNLMEVKARDGKILAFAPEGMDQIASIADDVFWMPKIRDELASIPYTIALQLFSYFTALELDREIDQPRNLAKSVTVE
ncbi:MAG: glutamine--fructose-6-phosphate transaminase (isomerizing) [Chlamydiae bacterium]|nr:glutamine--fructose-6-phosphate transaminase (isomerizing) [Chlamydiota bacterium]